MRKLTMMISGMTCVACVSSVRTALAEMPGVLYADVNVGSAQVMYDPALSTPDALRGAVAHAGVAYLAD